MGRFGVISSQTVSELEPKMTVVDWNAGDKRQLEDAGRRGSKDLFMIRRYFLAARAVYNVKQYHLE